MQFEAFRPILFPEIQASSVFMGHHVEVKVDSECLAVLYFNLAKVEMLKAVLDTNLATVSAQNNAVRAFYGLVTCLGAGWSRVAEAGGLQHEVASSLSPWANALCFCKVLSTSSQQSQHQCSSAGSAVSQAGLGTWLQLLAKCTSTQSCNHKIYNLMEIRAGAQRPRGLAVYHNDLFRSINAVNRKPIPSSLTYLSFEKRANAKVRCKQCPGDGHDQSGTMQGLVVKMSQSHLPLLVGLPWSYLGR